MPIKNFGYEILYKQNKERLLKEINFERQCQQLEPLLELPDCCKNIQWDFANQNYTEENMKTLYDKKTKPIIIMYPKLREKSCIIRGKGKLDY